MRTHFSVQQLADPQLAEADSILRKCVHCGLCTATCPTFVLLGDERDSPRGRIYMIKDMLESGAAADTQVVTHVDRCLSCLSCMTTCPSGVDYGHLVDQARKHIERTHKRPIGDRLMRGILSHVLPYPARFRLALRLAALGRPMVPILARIPQLKAITAMLALAPRRLPGIARPPTRSDTKGSRVILMRGCAQSVLAPQINRAAEDLLARLGIGVVEAPGEACCGALVHHLGDRKASEQAARRNIDAWARLIDAKDIGAIVMTASGCGSMVKDYAHLLRDDPAYREKAARITAMTQDISTFLVTCTQGHPQWPPVRSRPLPPLRIAYHAACTLQHGQGITQAPKTLLRQAGFTVMNIAEAHLCCGSAGIYNITQSDIANDLLARKLAAINAVAPDVIATGNIGCMTQIQSGTDIPVVHTVELLAWAAGASRPKGV